MNLPGQPEPIVPARLARPLLLAISAPSGAGKSVLCARLRADFPAMAYSISCTTRAPRGGERDGREYHFLAQEAFERKVRAGEFLEWAAVHDHRYGTLRAPVEAELRAGRDVLMDIDVQGAARIRAAARGEAQNGLLQRAIVDIFVVPPSLEALRQRMTGRAEDAEAEIEVRMRNAAKELRRWREYRYLLINDRLDEVYAELKGIVAAEHCRNMDIEESL